MVPNLTTLIMSGIRRWGLASNDCYELFCRYVENAVVNRLPGIMTDGNVIDEQSTDQGLRYLPVGLKSLQRLTCDVRSHPYHFGSFLMLPSIRIFNFGGSLSQLLDSRYVIKESSLPVRQIQFRDSHFEGSALTMLINGVKTLEKFEYVLHPEHGCYQQGDFFDPSSLAAALRNRHRDSLLYLSVPKHTRFMDLDLKPMRSLHMFSKLSVLKISSTVLIHGVNSYRNQGASAEIAWSIDDRLIDLLPTSLMWFTFDFLLEETQRTLDQCLELVQFKHKFLNLGILTLTRNKHRSASYYTDPDRYFHEEQAFTTYFITQVCKND